MSPTSPPPMSPTTSDGELLPAPGRAARVRLEDRVAVLDQREDALLGRVVLERPDRPAVHVQDRREGRLAARRREEALDLAPVGRRPAHAAAVADQLAARLGAGVCEIGQRPGLAAVDEHDRRSAIPGLDDGRERLAGAGRRGARVVAPAARAVADPDLRGHAVGRVARRARPARGRARRPRAAAGLRAIRARRRRRRACRPCAPHPRRGRSAAASPATITRSLQTASTTAAQRAVGRGGDPAELHVGAAQRARGAHRGVDQRELGAVPRALAGALGDDRDDARVAAPGRLPDVVARRARPAGARRSRPPGCRAHGAARPRPRSSRRAGSTTAARPDGRACPSRARRSARLRGPRRAAGCACRRATTRGARRCPGPR